MRIDGESSENIRVEIMEGSIYTVDEVSELLGIPRPTLYRYLREYSIPHLRQSGRISIPEDSFDRIREARDLHKEGLGTGSVRRQLREGAGPDTDEIDRRLDSLHETLQSLRGDLREKPAADEIALSPTLRTILARQSLMLSAMFNLTGMVEDLLLASGKPRKTFLDDAEGEFVPATTLAGGTAGVTAEGRLQIPAPPSDEPARIHGVGAPGRADLSRPDATAKFGSLGRRRRRGVGAILAALLICLGLALVLPALVASSDDAGTSGQATGGDAPDVRAQQREAAGDVGGEPTREDATATEVRARPEPPSGGQVGAAIVTEPAEAGGEPGGVPDVAGRGLEEAAREISAAGFPVAAIRTEESQREPGTVTGTEPATGTGNASPGAPVVLIVSGDPAASSPASVLASSSASASSVASAPSSVSASASPSP